MVLLCLPHQKSLTTCQALEGSYCKVIKLLIT